MPHIDVLALRPCGPCAAYVSADKGCAHWRPRNTAKALNERTPEQRAAAAEARRRQRAATVAAVANMRAMMTR